MIEEKLKKIASEHPFPLVFATVSGAHLYGFPSADSDYDLRGVHVLPVQDVIGLDAGRETIQVEEIRENLELDLAGAQREEVFRVNAQKEWLCFGTALFAFDCADFARTRGIKINRQTMRHEISRASLFRFRQDRMETF